MSKGHPLNPGYQPGNNWDTCDRCGFERRVSELKKEWTGLTVCGDTCWDPRHPQEFLRVREEKIAADHPGTQDDPVYLEPFALSWKTAVSPNFTVTTLSTGEEEIDANADGTVIFYGGSTNNAIYQIDLSTGYDLSTASDSGNSLDTSAQMTLIGGFHVINDGTELYVRDRQADEIEQYTLSTGWDLSTASHTGTLDISSIGTDYGLSGDATGKYLYIQQNDVIYQWEMSTLKDVTTATDTGKSFTLESGVTFGRAMSWDRGGRYFYLIDFTGSDTLRVYRADTKWDISTLVHEFTYSMDAATSCTGLVINRENKAGFALLAAGFIYPFVGTDRTDNTIPPATHTGSL